MRSSYKLKHLFPFLPLEEQILASALFPPLQNNSFWTNSTIGLWSFFSSLIKNLPKGKESKISSYSQSIYYLLRVATQNNWMIKRYQIHVGDINKRTIKNSNRQRKLLEKFRMKFLLQQIRYKLGDYDYGK